MPPPCTGTTRHAAVGIVVIGLLNFGMSFGLALVVALRARNVPAEERRTLPLAVFKRFTKHPLEFLFPPKEPPSERPAAQP